MIINKRYQIDFSNHKLRKLMLSMVSFILFWNYSNAQVSSMSNSKLDSLTKRINTYTKEDTVRIKLLNTAANAFSKTNPIKGLEYAEQSILICKNLKNNRLLCEALNAQASNYKDKNEMATAVDILQKAIALSDSLHYNFGLGINYLGLASILTKKSEFKSAKEYLDKTLSIFVVLNNKELIAKVYNEFGVLDYNQANTNDAVINFKTSLKINEEIGKKDAIAVSLANLGALYSNLLSDHIEALDVLQRAYAINKQLGINESMASNLNNLGLVYKSLSDYPKAIENFQKALAINEKLGNKKDISSNLSNISLVYELLGDYKMALDYQSRSISIEESLGRKKNLAIAYGNLGSIYSNLKNYKQAMEYLQKALTINESIAYKRGIAINLKNIGEIHLNVGSFSKALECQKQSLKINEEIKFKPGQSNNLQEIGTIFKDAQDSFVTNQGVALANRYKEAAKYYKQGLKIVEEINALNEQQNIWFDLSKCYELDARYKDAYDAYRNYINIKDSINNEDIKKRITQQAMQYSFDKKETELKYQQQIVDQKLQEQILYAKQKQQELELKEKKLTLSQQNEQLQRLAYLKEKAEKQEKQKQLSLSEKETQLKETQLQVLGKQKALKESELYLSQLELKSKALQRNIFIGGSILFLIVAFFIYVNFSNQKKSNAKLALLNDKVSIKNEQLTAVNLQVQSEKKKSDDLLLNILPAEIAEELKNKGQSDAKYYNNVTVLFTDFVGFTIVSEQLSPTELVAEIHRNFTAFDDIIEKHGLEKIKTIGDAYLAVCGLPIETQDHAKRVVMAALDIQNYILLHGGKFKIRIGINSGPVVAGIVGVKKYAYDIWGDTVNTAARMEQNSAEGKINISGATYDLIKNDFSFEHRGKIKAKNKGEIDMYFVNNFIS